jgi:hypothetical protein
MAISTKNIGESSSQESTRDKISNLREYHQPTFDFIGESNAYFYPKLAYKPHGLTEVCVSFFPSELKKGTDIYTEFVSRDYESEDPERTLWKYDYNPYWADEYEQTVPNSEGHVRYLVPVSELIKIKKPDLNKLGKDVRVINTIEEILQSKELDVTNKNNSETNTDLLNVLMQISIDIGVIANYYKNKNQ